MSALAAPIKAHSYLNIELLNKQKSIGLEDYKSLIQKANQVSDLDYYNSVDIQQIVYTRCWYHEQIILDIWEKSNIKNISLIAVGGFGRGELHPYSDIDLLLLKHKSKIDDLEKVRQFIQTLWDVGLEIGHSVRTIKECQHEASKDVSIATNLMESRLIHGDQSSYTKMKNKVGPDSIWSGAEFFEAKWQEQISRHRKFGGTAYNLEPNIKEGPGGLRDIQMISWVTQRHFHKKSLFNLIDVGFLTEDEYFTLNSGLKFLWKVRFALHILAGRKEERLLFGYQSKLASIFGYESTRKDNLAVEQFMQRYYKNVMNLERLNSRLLQLFDEEILQKNQQTPAIELNENYQLINNYIEIKQAELFQQKPTVWFELFLLLQENSKIKGIRANTSCAITDNLDCIDSNFRNNPNVQSQFVDLFRFEKDIQKTLNRMNRLGILAKYILPFGNIVGRMQFDLFHVYTVDQHSLFVIKNLYKIRTHQSSVQKAHIVFDQVKNPYVIYFAGLFHDIAKGRGGSHSELGAIDAYEFCQTHGINEENTELIIWLVKEHLIMSVTAQKKDINDPHVIEEFCNKVSSLEKLRCLYLLTIADISATDPKLWNGFKESLLNELYYHSENYINNIQLASLNDIKEKLLSHLVSKQLDKKLIESHIHNLPNSLYKSYGLEKLKQITTLICTKQEPVVEILNSNNDSYEFLFYGEDFTGLFYCIASIFEKYNLNIADAKINNTSNEYALNTFHCVADEIEVNHPALIKELRQVLKDKKIINLQFFRHQSLREKHFKVQAKFYLQESYTDNRTKIEVICKDRPGLLAIISKILLQSNITINAAKIATFGMRAEDSFWISYKNRKLTETQLTKLKQQLLEKL